MDIQNISSVTDTLHSLGFASHLGNKLLRHICFRKPEFVLKERMTIGSDIVNFNLVFSVNLRGMNMHVYTMMPHFVKEINVTGSVINGVKRKSWKERCRKLIGTLITKNKIDKEFQSEEKDSWLREEKRLTK